MSTKHPFSDMMRGYRFHRGLSLRQLAPEIGVSIATLNRIERGHDPDAETMLHVLAWMFGRKLVPLSDEAEG